VGTCCSGQCLSHQLPGRRRQSLPTFFASIVGLDEQGTARDGDARVLASSDGRLRQAVGHPRRWIENQNARLGYERQVFSIRAGLDLAPAASSPSRDVYAAPTAGGSGTGFALRRLRPADFSSRVVPRRPRRGTLAGTENYYRSGSVPCRT